MGDEWKREPETLCNHKSACLIVTDVHQLTRYTESTKWAILRDECIRRNKRFSNFCDSFTQIKTCANKLVTEGGLRALFTKAVLGLRKRQLCIDVWFYVNYKFICWQKMLCTVSAHWLFSRLKKGLHNMLAQRPLFLDCEQSLFFSPWRACAESGATRNEARKSRSLEWKRCVILC